MSTPIEWTDETWNPWHGCHKVSPGCKFCYMFREKVRYGQDPNVVVRSKTTFEAPLKWPQQPTLCFTCSWSDWLIEEADAWRPEAYEIIRRTPWITYQILTKRIERAAGRVPDPPLPNVWLGVSVEDTSSAARISQLSQTSAALRFVSYEPAIEAVDFSPWLNILKGRERWFRIPLFDTSDPRTVGVGTLKYLGKAKPDIDWIIIGGESGPGARPFCLTWARQVIEQCKAAHVPVFMKQLGARPIGQAADLPFLTSMKDRKGGAILEWPTDLRIREFPDSPLVTHNV